MKPYILVLPVFMLITACSSSNSGGGSSYKGHSKGHSGQRPNLNLSMFDMNNDGKVSRTEFLNAKLPNGRQPRDRMFNRIDSNSDGYITQREFDNMKAKRGRSRRNY